MTRCDRVAEISTSLVRTGGEVIGTPLDCAACGFLYYFLSSLIVVLGVLFGTEFLRPGRPTEVSTTDGFGSFANWDGQWYRGIVEKGYSYNPRHKSNVAFFPVYPLVGVALARTTGMNAQAALFLVSNSFLMISFMIIYKYSIIRYPSRDGRLPEHVLLALGLLPTSFFFRMTYSESTLLMLTVLTLYAMERRWPLLLIAAIVGTATATRFVGVSLVPVLLLHAWRRSATLSGFAARTAYLLPVALSGIGGFCLFLEWKFGDPLVFARTQSHWRSPLISAGDKALALATLKPFRDVLFNPGSSAYWRTQSSALHPLFNLHLVEPLYYLLTVALVAYGAARRWVSSLELLLSGLLLAIPYVTIGYERNMVSMARYSAVVVPVYLVVGNILCRIQGPPCTALLAIVGVNLFLYSSMFAARYPFY